MPGRCDSRRGERPRRDSIPRRGPDPQLPTRYTGHGQCQGCGGVVALPDVQESQAVQIAETASQDGQIGQRLGRVLVGRHGVDHRQTARRQLRQLGRIAGGAGDEGVEHAGEHSPVSATVSPVFSWRSSGP